MKPEQLLKFFNKFLHILFFYKMKINTNFSDLISKNFFLWKIANYADNYWFSYSNKKFTFELRYVFK